MSLRARWKEFRAEVRGRSQGRRAMGNDKELFHSARGIVGAIGWSFSNAWELLERDDGAYMRSMEAERRLPPSTFVSERDRTRHGTPMPLAERCIEDVRSDDAMPVGDWDIAELADD